MRPRIESAAWPATIAIDCESGKKRKDKRTNRQLEIAAGLAVLCIGIVIAVVLARFAIVTDENSPAANLMVWPFRVSFLLLAAAIVNVIYRFGKLKVFYRCPKCRQRIARLANAKRTVNYYCPACNVEWDTGAVEPETAD